MSKITGQFECEMHEEFGLLGVRPAWMPNSDPLTGMAAAHDLLEHFADDDGGVEAEFMALGASFLIRGNTGYHNRNGSNHSPESNIAADFHELYRHVAHEDFTLLDPGDVPPVEDEDLDAVLRKAARLGLELVRNEESYELDRDEDDDSVTLFCSEQSRERILGWLRKGFTKAEERYADVDIYTLAFEVFSNIEKRIDGWLESGEAEGKTLNIEVDLSNLSVTMEAGYDTTDTEDCYECEGSCEVDGEECETCEGDGFVDASYMESI